MTALSLVSEPPGTTSDEIEIASTFRRYADGFALNNRTPAKFVERGPSIAGRLMAFASLMTIRPIVSVGSYAPHVAWPWGVIEFACRALPQASGSTRVNIKLPHATAQLVHAPGVTPASGNRRVVLYMHGGAFLMGGANSHKHLVNTLSRHADAPVLIVNYRLLPKHSIAMAVDDCHDAYRWLRAHGFNPDQIVLAGDSAGGYLALTLAQRLQRQNERPAALVAISPLLQLASRPKLWHLNNGVDTMFSARAFDALREVAAGAAANHSVDGEPEELYEPLAHIEAGLPPTLIHVSGAEALLHDARLAARKLAQVGVPVELRIWPGQIHDFQVAAPMVPEAARSLRQIAEYIRRATPGRGTETVAAAESCR
ncbi:Carboxylesterase LipF [Mycobacterium basiliense]|uniref:Carboxylesterase LipF n=1 Tax=Mycobacterium basiliense TaxID=2094119 RepID=A0A447GAP9_9MYCO|nr:alpha/beta hydrolase [Mycobacterium basiliense]VDM87540.1 Carboxylesterase LipF [Mycobacterium basiliense]